MFLENEKKTDIQLIKETLENQDNFSLIITRYKKPLHRYIRRITNIHDEEIDDLLQEIFISVYQNLNSFNQNLQFSS